MSIITKFLKLFEYDPETDGASTFNIPKALNENWDKIDAWASGIKDTIAGLVPSTRTINKKPLSADVTLTGEDIPAGAEDEKTLSSHLAECQKALESKQDSIWLGIAEKDVDLNTLTQIGTIAIHGTSANVPPDVITTNWGLLSISANSKDGKAACTQHLSIMVSEGHFPNVYERNWNGINWSKWARVATATPPEEIPLQLAEGFSNSGGASSVYWKDQLNQVHVIISAMTPPIADANTYGYTVAMLPQGFRPTKPYFFNCSFADGNERGSGSTLNVLADGNILYFGNARSAGSLI